MFDAEAPSIRIWHQNDLAMFPGGGEHIGWPIFELDRFDDIERNHLESVDRLFVCSQWAKDVLKKQGMESRVDVVPLGVDGSVFYVDEDARAKRRYFTKGKTIFLNVGKWEVRKGHNELLEAFNSAFTPEDNVELWMMNQNPFIGVHNENWKTRYVASTMGPKIKLLPRVNTQAELRVLYNTVDFGVFPAHAEGWNLEPLEMMACGVPSIVTNYSGHTEFCNDSNSYLVEPNGMEKAQDGIGGRWFHGQGEWCTFSVDDLVDAMQKAHADRQANAPSDYERLCLGSLETAKKFTWANTIKTIESVL
jgi:glycosyltransferase involved in cell wall biosynthesis